MLESATMSTSVHLAAAVLLSLAAPPLCTVYSKHVMKRDHCDSNVQLQ
jgi:hypothetical protein